MTTKRRSGASEDPHGGREQPMTDWAPFAVPDMHVWRELQRRRHMIKMVDNLAQVARDEGFATCHELLVTTAERLRHLLIEVTPEESRAAASASPPARRPRKTAG